jgi:hypothetical protein
MATQDLTTLNDVKLWLGKDGAPIAAGDDTLLSRLITAASDFLLQQMNRDTLLNTSRTEVFSGNGDQSFTLKHFPVVSVTSVKVGSVVIPASADRIASGYWLDTIGAIHLFGYGFTCGRMNCEIVYTSGFGAALAALPNDIQQAAIELVSLKYRERKHIGVISEVIGAGMSTSYTQKDMSDSIRSVVDSYTRRF